MTTIPDAVRTQSHPAPAPDAARRGEIRLQESEAQYLRTLLRLAEANYQVSEVAGWRAEASTHAASLLAELERTAQAMGWALK